MQVALGRLHVYVTLTPAQHMQRDTASRQREDRRLSTQRAMVEQAYRRERLRHDIEADRAHWEFGRFRGR